MGVIGAERIDGIGDSNGCGNDGDNISGGVADNDDAHDGFVGDGDDNIVKVMTLVMATMIW